MNIDPSVIRQVSREKDIDTEKMFGALEEAMSSAARKFYHDKAMVTLIDRQTGAMTVYSPRTVVAEPDTESEDPPKASPRPRSTTSFSATKSGSIGRRWGSDELPPRPRSRSSTRRSGRRNATTSTTSTSRRSASS